MVKIKKNLLEYFRPHDTQSRPVWHIHGKSDRRFYTLHELSMVGENPGRGKKGRTQSAAAGRMG